jgi:phosphate starvation-inducible PhoH-like protein
LAGASGSLTSKLAGGEDKATDDKTVLHFDDNRIARDLFGEFDSHLSLIESRLGLEAIAHGNAVTLRGAPDARQLAASVLNGLYARIARGEQVVRGDVAGAIRHAATAPQRAETGGAAPELGQIRTKRRVITARTLLQSAYIKAMDAKDLVFATGPAGTGKTYLAVAYAASCLERGQVDRLILSRPAVEAGERLGFLPGDMREKVDPYLRPLYDALDDTLGRDKVERGLGGGTIEIAPLAFMRGRTLSNAFVILDEAQNCTRVQMKMILTRLGENSKMLITGDPSQIDLPAGQDSGLVDAIDILAGIDDIAHIAFTRADVVRRELVAKIVEAYEARP